MRKYVRTAFEVWGGWTMIAAWRLCPRLVDLDNMAWDWGWMMCVILGVVGLMRPNWWAVHRHLDGVWIER